MPPDTPEKQKMVSDFFSGPAAAPAAVERADKMMEILKTEYGHITKWAILGFCWGGKVY
jgi:dienelactone hydrolase